VSLDACCPLDLMLRMPLVTTTGTATAAAASQDMCGEKPVQATAAAAAAVRVVVRAAVVVRGREGGVELSGLNAMT
jgi:hypothetical protein